MANLLIKCEKCKCKPKTHAFHNIGFNTKCSKCDFLIEDTHSGELYEGSVTNPKAIKFCPNCGEKIEELHYYTTESVFNTTDWNPENFEVTKEEQK